MSAMPSPLPPAPQTRRKLVLEAIAAGLHVIADKPFAPNAAGGRELDSAAKAKGVLLSVYHNRRYDADMQTVYKLVNDGRLGKIWRVHSRMDQDGAHTLEGSPTGGLLRDLGSHVVDQMIYLLGQSLLSMPRWISLICRRGALMQASQSRCGMKAALTAMFLPAS